MKITANSFRIIMHNADSAGKLNSRINRTLIEFSGVVY